MASRDLTAARSAFETGDISASIAAHGGRSGTKVSDIKLSHEDSDEILKTPRVCAGHEGPCSPEHDLCKAELSRKPSIDGNPCIAEPGHGIVNTEMQKCGFYSAVDGTSTSIVIISLLYVTGIDLILLLKLTAAICTALSVSRGVRGWHKYTAEHAFYARERAREKWELENHPEGEIAEMVEICYNAGMTREDAQAVIFRMFKYPKLFVDLMMIHELKLSKPEVVPYKLALLSTLSYLFAALLPLGLLYLFYSHFQIVHFEFLIALIHQVIALIAKGLVAACSFFLLAKDYFLQKGTLMGLFQTVTVSWFSSISDMSLGAPLSNIALSCVPLFRLNGSNPIISGLHSNGAPLSTSTLESTAWYFVAQEMSSIPESIVQSWSVVKDAHTCYKEHLSQSFATLPSLVDTKVFQNTPMEPFLNTVLTKYIPEFMAYFLTLVSHPLFPILLTVILTCNVLYQIRKRFLPLHYCASRRKESGSLLFVLFCITMFFPLTLVYRLVFHLIDMSGYSLFA